MIRPWAGWWEKLSKIPGRGTDDTLFHQVHTISGVHQNALLVGKETIFLGQKKAAFCGV
jgi:hypothetical protein